MSDKNSAEAPETAQIDPAGVTPGLAEKATPKESVIFLKCRNEKCDSMEAVEIKLESPPQIGQRAYRCVKCNHTWALRVGGSFQI
jgi:hypothetical protein